MTLGFAHHHGAMLLKYSGISFISGAVNHGFFSGERSLWTAAIGMVLFVLGAVMAHRLDDQGEGSGDSLGRTLLLGALLSIGLGFFTGGLQHFPDSPARSAWVVPLGLLISLPALALSADHAWQRSTTVYALVLTAVVSAGSWSAWQWFERHPQYLGGHSHGPSGGHGDDHAHEAPAALQALVVNRSIEVRMDDRMRFAPDQIAVQAGETVRLVVHNDGQVPHELVLGSDADIQAHAADMQKGADHAHSHSGGAAIHLGPGERGELVVRFAQAGTLQMACLIPGHYEAGMRGQVRVQTPVQTPVQGQGSAAKAAPAKPAHDHSTHKH